MEEFFKMLKLDHEFEQLKCNAELHHNVTNGKEHKTQDCYDISEIEIDKNMSTELFISGLSLRTKTHDQPTSFR